MCFQARPTPTTEEPQYSRQAQAQYTRAQNVVRAPQKQTYSSAKQDDYEKPLRPQRTRKPVAQVGVEWNVKQTLTDDLVSLAHETVETQETSVSWD